VESNTLYVKLPTPTIRNSRTIRSIVLSKTFSASSGSGRGSLLRTVSFRSVRIVDIFQIYDEFDYIAMRSSKDMSSAVVEGKSALFRVVCPKFSALYLGLHFCALAAALTLCYYVLLVTIEFSYLSPLSLT
jgi:hypothetical protein